MQIKTVTGCVALRKESVDRNVFGFGAKLVHSVALRKESVDRNREQFKYVVQCRKSLSVRRAWIEIINQKENAGKAMSLSVRRAWIEMDYFSAVMRQNPGRSP